VGGGRKDGAILETGILSPRLRVKPPYRSMLEISAPPAKFSAQQRMLSRINGRDLLAWRGVDSALSTEGIR
jgi:hypothetical protein